MFRLIFILFAIFAISCKGKKDTAVSENPVEAEKTVDPRLQDSLWVTYERTPCFGTCPVFKFSMYSDGTARYEGKNFVDRMGSYEGRIPKDAFDRIFSTAERLGYYNLEKSYDNVMVTDLPACYTDIMGKDGKRKFVNNRYQGPAEIREIYTLLDEIMESIEWNRIENKQ